LYLLADGTGPSQATLDRKDFGIDSRSTIAVAGVNTSRNEKVDFVVGGRGYIRVERHLRTIVARCRNGRGAVICDSTRDTGTCSVRLPFTNNFD